MIEIKMKPNEEKDRDLFLSSCLNEVKIFPISGFLGFTGLLFIISSFIGDLAYNGISLIFICNPRSIARSPEFL